MSIDSVQIKDSRALFVLKKIKKTLLLWTCCFISNMPNLLFTFYSILFHFAVHSLFDCISQYSPVPSKALCNFILKYSVWIQFIIICNLHKRNPSWNGSVAYRLKSNRLWSEQIFMLNSVTNISIKNKKQSNNGYRQEMSQMQKQIVDVVTTYGHSEKSGHYSNTLCLRFSPEACGYLRSSTPVRGPCRRTWTSKWAGLLGGLQRWSSHTGGWRRKTALCCAPSQEHSPGYTPTLLTGGKQTHG